MTSRPIRLAGAALLAAGSIGVLAACGSDNSSSNSGSDAKLTASCNANAAVNDGFNKFFSNTPALQSNGPPSKKDLPQVRANFDKYVGGPLAQIQKDPPDQIAGDIKTAVAQVSKIREGDTQTFQNPNFGKTTARIDAYYFDNCKGQKGDVKALDYAYDGLKPTYSAGLTQFKMQNTGKEVHEMNIARLKPGVKLTFAQILKLPESQADKYVVQVAGADPVPAGQSSYASADLTPGKYIAICFIPQGTTSLQKPGKGKPHFLLGMQKEFSVQ